MSRHNSLPKFSSARTFFLLFFLFTVSVFSWNMYTENDISKRVYKAGSDDMDLASATTTVLIPKLDTVLYDKKMLQLANLPPLRVHASSSTSTLLIPATSSALWPVKTAYPSPEPRCSCHTWPGSRRPMLPRETSGKPASRPRLGWTRRS